MEKFELTFPQKNIWLVEQFYSDQLINIISGSLVINQDFDTLLAEKTVNKFVELNDGMRIKICIEDNMPKQYVVPFVPFVTEKTNVVGKSEKEIEDIKQEYVSRHIDILQEPLFSYLLIDRGEGKGEIFLKTHHLICDAWAISRMGTELSGIYEALLHNETYIKENPSYLEYIKNEKEYMGSEKFSKDSDFWSNYLSGMEDSVGLKDSSIESDSRAKRYTVHLNKNIQDLINSYCKDNKLSPYVIFMVALGIYMERVTSKKDFAIGTPVLNRANFKEKNMVGMFVSTMPARFKIDENMSFLDLCKVVATDFMTMFRHQKYPYSKISEEYKNKNDVTENMYKVMLSYQNARADLADDEKYEVTWRFSGNIQDQLEIHIMDMNDTGKLSVHFDYLTSLFEDIEIEYLAKRVLAIITDGISGNKTIKDINIMSDEEKNKILCDFNDTKTEYPRKETVVGLFEKQVKLSPDSVALILDNNTLTYSELNNRAQILAEVLKKHGINEGDCVGISIDKSFELLVAIIAVLKIGAFYLPIEINYSNERKKYMLDDTGAKILIQDSEEVFDVESINICNMTWEGKTNNDASYRSKKYNEESPLCILYTSGTTGEPKGAIIKNKNVVKLVKGQDYMSLSSDDVILQAASTSFDVSLFEFWGSLLNGGVCVLIKKSNLLDFEYLYNYMMNKKITVAWITAALFNQIIDGNIEVFSKLRTVLSGGDIMSLKHVNKLRSTYKNLEIINCYGPTECTTFTNTYRISKTSDTKMPLGKAISNTYGYVLDKDFRLLPLYVEGEYVIGGDSVAAGYINKPELTSQKFVNDTITKKGIMYKSGDVVRMLEGGYIDFVGRRDNQVKIRGYRIELDEVKLAIQKYPNIEDTYVFIYEDSMKNKKIVAYYVSKNEINSGDIKEYLKENLISYMVPSYIEQIDKLPLNQNGKVDVKALKSRLDGMWTNSERTYNVKYTGLAKVFYNIFRDVLNKEEIYPDESFFEIGGDSLMAIKVITESMAKGMKITFADLYKYSSINDLVDFVNNHTKGSISENIDTYDYSKINQLLANNTIVKENKISTRKLGNVLLTGSTGFLGAHILSYLMDNTRVKVYCLVRKINGEDIEQRLRDRLRFFFKDKYDKQFKKRIILVQGDVILEDITTNKEDLQTLKDNVQVIINCAAYVKHFGDLKLFSKINYEGPKNMAKFAFENNKRLIQVSTLSVSGNILEVGQIQQTGIKKGTIYNEHNFYIGQNLDNVYAYTKFMGEKVVYEYMLKGLDACIMRMGNLTSRLSDGKFQPNVEENAFANRLKTVIDLKVMPKNILDFYLEFTPIDCAAEAICRLACIDGGYNTYHLFNHNHMQMEEADKIFNEIGINLKHISKAEMTKLIDHYINQDEGYNMLKGVVQDLNKNKELDYTPNTIIKSDFTIEMLKKVGFKWPKINKKYIKQYMEYLYKINFFKGE